MAAPIGKLIANALLLAVATPLIAGETEDFIWASNMASVIGSADACGFKLSEERVDAFVSTKIAKLDAGTRANFYNTLTVTPDELAALPSTSKAAQCSLQRAVAKREGLMQ